ISNWDECGYLAAVTPPTLTKEVNSENYLNADDGFADKSSGTKDAGDFTFQLGYAPARTEQQRLVDLFDEGNGEREKWWYAVLSPTEDPDKPVINMYYGILSSLGTPNAVENSAHMKRDVTISLQGRPKLAEDLLRQLAAVP
ncbi:phage tail protein, partial [Vibrio fluvialis]